MDYKIMWIYFKNSISKSDMTVDLRNKILNKIKETEQKERDGELIQLEIADKVKWVKSLLDEDRIDAAIVVAKGIVELKLKQFSNNGI